MTACLIPSSLSPSEVHKNVVTVTLRIHFKIIIVNSFLAFNSYALLNRLWHAQFKLQILNLLEWHFFLRLFCVKCSRVSVAILRRWLKVVIVKWQIVIEKKVLERLALRRHGRDMLTKDLDDRSEKINLLMLLLTALGLSKSVYSNDNLQKVEELFVLPIMASSREFVGVENALH